MEARRTRIKFCGMTSAADATLAVASGADAVGAILAPSERQVSLDAAAAIAGAIPGHVERVAVVVDPSDADAARLRRFGFTLQFSGDESAATCRRLANGAPYYKVFHVDPGAGSFDRAIGSAYADAMWMFDTRIAGRRGGTGRTFDWHVVAALARKRSIVISGGLDPENVAACIHGVGPYGVDVRSGVERNGRKDPERMNAFVNAVRAADAALLASNRG